MSRQQWKSITLFLAAPLMSILILMFVAPFLTKALAQNSISTCSDARPTDWIFQDAQSLMEQYGVVVCRQDGTIRQYKPETRASMAGLLAPAIESVNRNIEISVKRLPKKSELNSLNQLLKQTNAQVEILERR